MSKDGLQNGNKTLKEHFNSTTGEFFYEELPDIVLNFLKGKTNCSINKLGDSELLNKGPKVKLPESKSFEFKSKPPWYKREGPRLVKPKKRTNLSPVLKSQISNAVAEILKRTEKNQIKRTGNNLSNNVSVTGLITRRKQSPVLPFVKHNASFNTLPYLLKQSESINEKSLELSEKNIEQTETNSDTISEHWSSLTVENDNIYFTPCIGTGIIDKELQSSVLAKISLDSFLEVAKALQCPSELKTSIIQNSTSYFERYLNKKHGIYFVDTEQDSKNLEFDNIADTDQQYSGTNDVDQQSITQETNLLNICIKSIEDHSNIACFNLFTNSNETVEDSIEKQSEISSAEIKEANNQTSCEETSLSAITNSLTTDKENLSEGKSRKKKITISLSYKQLVKLVKSLETAPLDQGNAVTVNLGNANPKHVLELKVHNTGQSTSDSSKVTKKRLEQSKNVIKEINKLQEIIADLQRNVLDTVTKTPANEQPNIPREIAPKKSIVIVDSEQVVPKPLFTQKTFENNKILTNAEPKYSQPYLERSSSTLKLLNKSNEQKWPPLLFPTNKKQTKVIQKVRDSSLERKNYLTRREKEFNTSTSLNTKPNIVRNAGIKFKNSILNGLKLNDRKINNRLAKKQPFKLNCQQTVKTIENKFVRPNTVRRIPEETASFVAEKTKRPYNYRKTIAGKSTKYPIQPLLTLQKSLKSNLVKINELNKKLYDNKSISCESVPISTNNPLYQDLNEYFKNRYKAKQKTEIIKKETNLTKFNNKLSQNIKEETDTRNAYVNSREATTLKPISTKKVILETFGGQFTPANNFVQNEDESKKILSELLNNHLLNLNGISKLNLSRQLSKSDSHIGKDQISPVVLHQNKGVLTKIFSEHKLNFNKPIQCFHHVNFKHTDKQTSECLNEIGPQNKSIQCMRSLEYVVSQATIPSAKSKIQTTQNSGKSNHSLKAVPSRPVSQKSHQNFNNSQRSQPLSKAKLVSQITSKQTVPKSQQQSNTDIAGKKLKVTQLTVKSRPYKTNERGLSKPISRTKSTPFENSTYNLISTLPKYSRCISSTQKTNTKVNSLGKFPNRTNIRTNPHKFPPQRTYPTGTFKPTRHTNSKKRKIPHTVSKATSVSHSRTLLASSNTRDNKQKSHSTISSKTHPRSISLVNVENKNPFVCEFGDTCNVIKKGLVTQPEDIEQNNNNSKFKNPNCLCITEEQYSQLYSAVADKKNTSLKCTCHSNFINNLHEQHTGADQQSTSTVLPNKHELCHCLSEKNNKINIRLTENQMCSRGSRQGGSPCQTPCSIPKHCAKCQNLIQPTCSGSPPKLCRKCKKPLNPLCPSFLPEPSPCLKHVSTVVPKSLKCARCQAPITRVENYAQHVTPHQILGPVYGKPVEAEESTIKQDECVCQLPNKKDKPTCSCRSNTHIVYPLFIKSKQESDIDNKRMQSNPNEYKRGNNSYNEHGRIPKQLDLYNSSQLPSIITCPSAPPKDLFEYPSSIQDARL